jgi:ferritin-like metal-binding protein YciE
LEVAFETYSDAMQNLHLFAYGVRSMGKPQSHHATILGWRQGDGMQTTALRKLYVDELKDLFSAENQLLKALPKMAKAADADELRSAFEDHLGQTRGHVARLEKIFREMGESPKGKKCKGMEGLIVEGGEMIEEDPGPEELDAGLIAAAQRVEHYEMAGYGCVKTYATLLGEDRAAALLSETLGEEKAADSKLTDIAGQINVDAAETESGANGNGKPKTRRKR